MELFCQNTEKGLLPLYPSDLEEKKKLKIGKVYKCNIKLARSYLFHKKFFALCQMGFENSKEKFIKAPNLDIYRKYVIIRVGFVDLVQTPGGIIPFSQSISFENMDEAKFEEVYHGALDFIIADIEASKEDIEKELGDFF